MPNRPDPHDPELFERSTAATGADWSTADDPLAAVSVISDSSLSEVGIDSDRPRVHISGIAPNPESKPRPLAPALSPLPFGDRYVQRRVLGRGGMGEVRLCRDHTIGRDVALKVIRPRSGEASLMMQRRFVREARVQGQLEHPAIVPVYDAGVDPSGALYFTMKRVQGLSLANVLAALRANDAEMAQRYSQRRLLTLLSQVCMAVHYGHQKGVVHRDLKPANIMLGSFGEVYLLDWGLAGLRGDGVAESSGAVDDGHGLETHASSVLGTPGYMSPEQVQSPVAVDPRADVYALGAILFEVLTLQRLHEAPSPAEALAATLQLDGASPAARAPERAVPPELDRLCRAMTRLLPHQRIDNAQHVSQRIEAYLDGDRDLALRRELARTHADAAQAVFSSRDASPRARAHAMREVNAALGLDPTHQGARQTLVRLITEPPPQVPPEAQAEIDANQRAAYQIAGKAGVLFYFGYLLYLPLLLWMGVRDLGLFAMGWVLIGVCALTTYLLLRYPPKRADVPLMHLFVSTLTVAAVSVMFGPFVLVPMLALGNGVAYISSIGARRGLVPLASCSAVVVPQLLRMAGVLPNNYVFAGGNWTILPSVFYLSPLATQVFLLVGIVGTIVPACMFVSRLRAAYAEAEQKLQLQAWQLKQIVPEHTEANA